MCKSLKKEGLYWYSDQLFQSRCDMWQHWRDGRGVQDRRQTLPAHWMPPFIYIKLSDALQSLFSAYFVGDSDLECVMFNTLWKSTPLRSYLFSSNISGFRKSDIYAFEWLSLTNIFRKFQPTFSVLPLLASESPVLCVRTSSIQLSNTLETCKDIYAFEWLSFIIFWRNFVLPFYINYPLKVHSTVLIPLLFKHIRIW